MTLQLLHPTASPGFIPLLGLASLSENSDNDALLSRRPYKMSWDKHSVCQYFREQSGKQFDSGITALLLDNIDDILMLYKDKGELT